ncbi:MAG: RHS repeat protein [Clostridia bacterium]|nr:RHS repeat protein [Clostridia bacterium]
MKQPAYYVALYKCALVLLCLVLLLSGVGCSTASETSETTTPTNATTSNETASKRVEQTVSEGAGEQSPSTVGTGSSLPAKVPFKTKEDPSQAVSSNASESQSNPPAKVKEEKKLTRIVCNYRDAEDEEYVFEYDQKGRIVTILNRKLKGGSEHKQSLTYDQKGHLVLMRSTSSAPEAKSNEKADVQYQYNQKGQLISERSEKDGGFETTHSYNGSGQRVRSVTLSGGTKNTLTYQYDAKGLLTEAIYTTKGTSENTHKVQTLHYDTEYYKPFTMVTTFEKDKPLWTTLEFWNKDQMNLLSQNTISLHSLGGCSLDQDEYLAELNDSNGNTYVFYYNGKKAEKYIITK